MYHQESCLQLVVETPRVVRNKQICHQLPHQDQIKTKTKEPNTEEHEEQSNQEASNAHVEKKAKLNPHAHAETHCVGKRLWRFQSR